MKIRYNLGLILSLTLLVNINAQDKYAFGNKIINIQFLYNYHVPSGDISKLYTNFNAIGGGSLLKTKNNWVYATELSYLFGHDIKNQALLDNLVNGGGYIASASGSPSNYSVNMRGFDGFIKAGRLFGWNKYNMNSGILVMGGIGFLTHYTNFQIQGSDAIPQLDKDYQKGYDRFTSGIAFNQFVGYYFHSRNRLINFYAGFELMQAVTHNRRGFNYDTREFDMGTKHDFTSSIRLGWMIPIYLNTKDENEFQFR